MIRYLLLFFICFFVLQATAQEKTVIEIKHSDVGHPEKTGVNRLIGNVKLEHKNIVMTCDSLYQYRDSNYIEAFGRVHVVQDDPDNQFSGLRCGQSYRSLFQRWNNQG